MELRNKITEQDENAITVEAAVDSDVQEAGIAETATQPESISEPEAVSEKKSFFKSGLFTKPFVVLCSVFIFSVIVYLVSRFSPVFAEFWTKYPAQGIRFLTAKLTGWIPFSLAEATLVSLPIIGVAYVIGSTVSTHNDESNLNFYRWLRPLISVVLVVAILFLIGFGPAYGRFTVAENLNLEQSPVSANELYSTALKVVYAVKEDISGVNFDSLNASIMPYSYNTLIEKMNEAFDKYAESADYIGHFGSNPKPIALSELMTYTHISGVYTFMTGESNINTNYPDFLIPFTMAHEMAHQRGIAREDEANFVAFLVCIGSDDVYIRYCGYTNMLNYLNSALSKADSTLYRNFVLTSLPEAIRKEFVAYSQFFDKYRDSTASEVTGTVNNAFLQSQGQTHGTKSYGLVVDLAVAYYK